MFIYTTLSFETWWSSNFNKILKSFDECFSTPIADVPSLQIGNSDAKNSGTHCRETMGFEKFFRIPYSPKDMSSVVLSAALILVDKIRDIKQNPSWKGNF
jgi:hypothetical protein